MKRGRVTEQDETASSHSNSSGAERAKIQQLELEQQRMKAQMDQLLQLMNGGGGTGKGSDSANNGSSGDSGVGSGGTAYPCAGFGQLPFKREAGDASSAASISGSATSRSTSNSATSNNNSHENNGSHIDNNNTAGTEALDKEKLWKLFCAGKVSIDGATDVKPKAGSNRAVDAPEAEIEEEEEEEEDPSREGFAVKDWALVYDDGKIDAILCEVCRYFSV